MFLNKFDISDNKKKIIIASAGGVLIVGLVILLCIIFSGTGANDVKSSDDNSIIITLAHDKREDESTSHITTANTTAETTANMTEVTTKATTAANTEETTVKEIPATTDKPKPLWTEKQITKTTKYINESCNSRVQALNGTTIVKSYTKGNTVQIVATTDTNYSKLADGSFIHNDFLSDKKPVDTTTPKPTPTVPETAAPKPTPTVPETTPPKPTPSVPETTAPEPTKPEVNVSAFAREVFELMNKERASNGLAPLIIDNVACKAAQIRSVEASELFEHVRPNGKEPYTAFDFDGDGKDTSYDELGKYVSAMGENIAKGQTTPAWVMESWMNSPGHKKNILDPDFTHVGVGYSAEHNTWAQLFLTYR